MLDKNTIFKTKNKLFRNVIGINGRYNCMWRIIELNDRFVKLNRLEPDDYVNFFDTDEVFICSPIELYVYFEDLF